MRRIDYRKSVGMSAKYLKVKVNGKWKFVPIPTPYEEYYVKLTCECEKCVARFHSSVYIREEE
jgi:hypothetical protein